MQDETLLVKALTHTKMTFILVFLALLSMQAGICTFKNKK